MKNVCRFALCNDIETNPGPAIFHINPSKTVSAPYNQGNQIIFGETAGQQCLAMCLCALIYNKRQEISSPQDLIQVMNIGNELYSKLSHLARQSFLMFSELPSYLTVFGYTAFILTIDSNAVCIYSSIEGKLKIPIQEINMGQYKTWTEGLHFIAY